MSSTQKENSILKIGLIFVKSKDDEEGSSLNSSKGGILTPGKGGIYDKWIVVAGNSYNANTEEDRIDKLSTNQICEDFIQTSGSRILDQPLLLQNIVQLHLDSVFKEKSVSLSLELFKCVNVQVLSLRHNNITSLPADIGRLTRLRTLILTENCLTTSAIPYTLTFCQELKELYLDNNLLDALPGFLLDMSSLETVYRHGNHNYFKCTFMWYHTAQGDRVMPLRNRRVVGKQEANLFQPQSLESIATRALISSRINFFSPGLLPVTLQDSVAKVYSKYKICGSCSGAHQVSSQLGCKVFTFKSPYLGNTCVPFEHWTCCRDCGVKLESPAYKLERAQTRKLDQQYQEYIKSVQDQLCQKAPDKWLPTCSIL